MRYLITRVLLLVLPIAFGSTASFADTNLDIAIELSKAILDKDFFRPKSLANYKVLKAALDERTCTHRGSGRKKVRIRYRQIRLDDSVYVLGIYKKRAVLSKHFRYQIKDNQALVDSLTESSETCIHLHFSHPLFTFDDSDGDPALYPLEESVRLAPNELQAFVSFFNGQPLNVHTTAGVWRIREGATTFNMETTSKTPIDGDDKNSLTQCPRVSVPDNLKPTLEPKRTEYFDVCLACENNQCKFWEKITYGQLVPCARLFCKAVSGAYPGLEANTSRGTHRIIDYQYSIQQDGVVRIDSVEDSHADGSGTTAPEVLRAIEDAIDRVTYSPIEIEGEAYEMTGLRNLLAIKLSN